MKKIDKGFALIYCRLSNRRKFIRTLWTIPWAVFALIIIQIIGRNAVQTFIWGVVLCVVICAQLFVTYRRWKGENNQITQSDNHEQK